MREKRTKIQHAFALDPQEQVLTVMGWVRTKRASKNVAFIALNDGSTINNLQVVADAEKFGEDLLRRISTGASLSATGKLVASQGAGQSVELVAESIEVFGEADSEKYPLQPKKT